MSDSGKFFVFRGPHFYSKEEKEVLKRKRKNSKKEEKVVESGGKKAPRFYIFKLVQRQKLSGDEWVFMPYSTGLFPFIEERIA